jgi:alkylation response protein AidB-like acyl-CoA dehydrogenase
MEGMFIQTESQRAIVETVRRFVEDEVTPRAAASKIRKAVIRGKLSSTRISSVSAP